METIKTKQQLKDWLKLELSRYGKFGLKDIILKPENYILRKHQIILRKAEYYTNTNNQIMRAIYLAKLYRIQNKFGIHIPVNTCGKGLKIMHVGPVLINPNATLDENCSLHINTAIAAKGLDDKAPKLGKGVVVGVGAVILGGIKIANNVAIGANSVVTKNILEEDIAVAGVPAKKISDNGRSKWK